MRLWSTLWPWVFGPSRLDKLEDRVMREQSEVTDLLCRILTLEARVKELEDK